MCALYLVACGATSESGEAFLGDMHWSSNVLTNPLAKEPLELSREETVRILKHKDIVIAAASDCFGTMLDPYCTL